MIWSAELDAGVDAVDVPVQRRVDVLRAHVLPNGHLLADMKLTVSVVEAPDAAGGRVG